ncbi:serine protease Hayan-like [Bacillus rossius redtenbacheri]|uniref:serine protease Hayan-like n=1 Tax=Bacillus rossius redtenbacheri TaxID=93214 RepID=UPI002FDD8819
MCLQRTLRERPGAAGMTVRRLRPASTLVVAALCFAASASVSAQRAQAEKQVGDPCRGADGFWGVCALSRNCGSFALRPAVSAADVCASSGRRLVVCCGAAGRPQAPPKRSTTTRGPANDPWWLAEAAFDEDDVLPAQPPARPWWADTGDRPFSARPYDDEQGGPNRPANSNKPYNGNQASPNRPYESNSGTSYDGEQGRPNRPTNGNKPYNSNQASPNRPYDGNSGTSYDGEQGRPNRPTNGNKPYNGNQASPNRPYDSNSGTSYDGNQSRPNRPANGNKPYNGNQASYDSNSGTSYDGDQGRPNRPSRPTNSNQSRPNKPYNNNQASSNRPYNSNQASPNRPYDGDQSRPNRPTNGNKPYNSNQASPSRPLYGRPEEDDDELIAFPGPTGRPPSVATPEETLYINPPFMPSTDPPRRQTRRRISETKCDEYSQQVRSNVSALPLVPDPEPISLQVANCNYNGVLLIVGGEKTVPGEFPHMAALGYRDGRNLAWNCGGTLISEYYVLTAAHCTYTGSGPPAVVRLGEYNLRSSNDGAQPVDYAISKVIRHPEYKPPAKYNDIGLLRLARRVAFSRFIRPACLYTRDYFSVDKTTATGWGRIDYAESASDVLLKVTLSIIDNNKCNQLYRSDIKTNTLSKGILPSMLCAGELKGGKDTCQGDSGGPIQISSRTNQCIHYIIGITSFGKFCAGKNAPGVYTRVSYFVPWIESIVWPSN